MEVARAWKKAVAPKAVLAYQWEQKYKTITACFCYGKGSFKQVIALPIHLLSNSGDVYCTTIWISGSTLVHHFWVDGGNRAFDVDIFGGDCCKEVLPSR